ncbi:MAG: NAD-dependent epimerase/dehydratase family protein [Anaerolineaceae bacterium]|nr:NAD-dependent epimerase/dehydratase family protein [Anaerolineaceae bacterium]
MIFVTGGTGLVGSYLLYELTRRGHKVRALLRPGKKPYDTRKLFNCLSVENEHLIDQVEWIEGDVLDPFSLQQAMQNIDYVYHCAAFISFNPRELKEMLAVNVEGTANVVNACIENGVKKLCHVSSIASLGQAEKGEMIDENAKWKTSRINSGYAISKYGGEREVWRGIEEGLNAVIVNPSIIIGAGCHPKATNKLFHSIKKFIPYYSSGVNGYVDVRDVVAAMVLLLESDISGERFVLNSENLSLREFFIKAADILGKPHPRIAINGPVMLAIAWLDEMRGRLTKSSPLITRENVRSAMSKSFYSAEKFKSAFNFSFVPMTESLTEAFRVLNKK